MIVSSRRMSWDRMWSSERSSDTPAPVVKFILDAQMGEEKAAGEERDLRRTIEKEDEGPKRRMKSGTRRRYLGTRRRHPGPRLQ